MSATVIEMNSLTTSLDKGTLAKLTWAEIDGTTGLLRMALIKDLERNDIRPEVAIDPAALERFRPGEVFLPARVGDLDYTLTATWQPVLPRYANALAAARREDVNLGAPGMTTEVTDEYGLIKAPPRAHQGFPGLIRFRMPCEAPKIATTTVVAPKEK